VSIAECANYPLDNHLRSFDEDNPIKTHLLCSSLEYKALPGTLQNNTIAITVQANIKGLVDFGGVGRVAVSGYCDRW
jgi:hypothetical protein